MPRKEFIQMGKVGSTTNTADKFQVRLAGIADGYGFKLLEFRIWGAKALDGPAATESWGILTRDSTLSPDPLNPDFSNKAFLGVASFILDPDSTPTLATNSLVNDNDILTQDIYGFCANTAHYLTNWFLRFETVKLSTSAEAVANYNAFSIRD